MPPELTYEAGSEFSYHHVYDSCSIEPWENTKGHVRRLCAAFGKPITA